MTSRFRVAGLFEASALNEPHMTWNIKRSDAPHVHVATTPDSKFTPSCSMASRFRVTEHFETSTPFDPKMMLNTKRPKVPQICDIPGFRKFTPFHSTTIHFQDTDNFSFSHWPQWYFKPNFKFHYQQTFVRTVIELLQRTFRKKIVLKNHNCRRSSVLIISIGSGVYQNFLF